MKIQKKRKLGGGVGGGLGRGGGVSGWGVRVNVDEELICFKKKYVGGR